MRLLTIVGGVLMLGATFDLLTDHRHPWLLPAALWLAGIVLVVGS